MSNINHAAEEGSKKVSDAKNPCPFMRALQALGYIAPQKAPLANFSHIVTVAMDSGIEKPPPKFAIKLLALLASAKSVSTFIQTFSQGFSVDNLRLGPLDKRGVGSGIIDLEGNICEDQLIRLDSFASDFEDESGTLERGLDAAALNKMMDENFARPSKHRRWFDRLLMNGEWPALLEAMGKTHLSNPYLSLSEVQELFVDRQLPERVVARLPLPSRLAVTDATQFSSATPDQDLT